VLAIFKIASDVVWKAERFRNRAFHGACEVVERARVWRQRRDSCLRSDISVVLRCHSYTLRLPVLRCMMGKTIPSQVEAAPHRPQSADPSSPCETIGCSRRSIESEIEGWHSIRHAGWRSTRIHRRSAGGAYSTGKDQFLRRFYQISKNRLKTHKGHSCP
jgi:hypothetical protein